MKGRDVPPIKAIETEYNGYRFRSRLEARWAVLLDSLGLNWKYEVEGYAFSDLAYLPDFFLPEWGVYLEVKGTDKPSYQQLYKPALFAARIEHPLLFCFGGLDPRQPMFLVGFGSHDPEADARVCLRPTWFIQCPLCSSVSIVQTIPAEDKIEIYGSRDWTATAELWVSHPSSGMCPGAGIKLRRDRQQTTDQDRIDDAYTAARQARFEHGEHGRRK